MCVEPVTVSDDALVAPYARTVGVLVALTLPGLVLALLVVAAADQVLLRARGRGLAPWRREAPVSATGFELLHAALAPGKADELAQRHSQELVRDHEEDGAPPRSGVDLDRGVARLRVPRSRGAGPAR